MGRRVYHVVDGTSDVPDLRRGALSRPLSTRVKVVATTIGAIVSIGGYTLGVGKWMLAKLDEHVTVIARRENAPVVSSIQASDRQRNEQHAKTMAAVDELKALVTKLSEKKRR